MTAITLPWKVLVPDNARHGLFRGRILLTSKYRMALYSASLLAAAQWPGAPIKGPVSLAVTLYEPDKRRRDVLNYGKLIGDALSMVVIVDDSQIDHATMIRGGIDRYNPRAVIEVTPLPAEPTG
jgi:Holliday junction resolvase RusA-like endonuclease